MIQRKLSSFFGASCSCKCELKTFTYVQAHFQPHARLRLDHLLLILTLRASVCCVTAPSPVTVPGPHRAALKPDRYRLDPSVGGNGAV